MFILKSKPIAPPTEPTHNIYPVHYWDDTTTFRSAVLYNLFRVDDTLGAQKLEAAPMNLINRTRNISLSLAYPKIPTKPGYCRIGAAVAPPGQGHAFRQAFPAAQSLLSHITGKDANERELLAPLCLVLRMGVLAELEARR